MILPTARGQTSRARSSMGRESDFSFARRRVTRSILRARVRYGPDDSLSLGLATDSRGAPLMGVFGGKFGGDELHGV